MTLAVLSVPAASQQASAEQSVAALTFYDTAHQPVPSRIYFYGDVEVDHCEKMATRDTPEYNELISRLESDWAFMKPGYAVKIAVHCDGRRFSTFSAFSSTDANYTPPVDFLLSSP